MLMHNPVSPKTVLVTGAAGFLGSHLCDVLLSRGHSVIGVDDLSHGDRSNLSAAAGNPRFEFHTLDITDIDKLERVSDGVDIFANLAAFKIPRYGNRLQTLQVNCHGMLNVLKLAAAQRAKLVFTSTSDV